MSHKRVIRVESQLESSNLMTRPFTTGENAKFVIDLPRHTLSFNTKLTGQEQREEGEEDMDRSPQRTSRQVLIRSGSNPIPTESQIIGHSSTGKKLIITRWDVKRWRGCVLSPPSLLQVPGRGKETDSAESTNGSFPILLYKESRFTIPLFGELSYL